MPEPTKLRYGVNEEGDTYVNAKDLEAALTWQADHTDNLDFRAGCLALRDELATWREDAETMGRMKSA